jgi:hypothetical protein
MDFIPFSASDLEKILGSANHTAWNESIDNRFLVLLKRIMDLEDDAEDVRGQVDGVSGRVGSVEDDVSDLQDQIDIEWVGKPPLK